MLQEVQMEVLPSEFTIRDTGKSNLFLLGDKSLDRFIFHLSKLRGGDFLVKELVTGLVNGLGSKERADCRGSTEESVDGFERDVWTDNREYVPCSGLERIGLEVATILGMIRV